MSYEQIDTQPVEGDALKTIVTFFSVDGPEDAFFLRVPGLNELSEDLNDKVNRFFIQQELPWRMQSAHWDSDDQVHVFLFRGVDVSEVFTLHTEPL